MEFLVWDARAQGDTPQPRFDIPNRGKRKRDQKRTPTNLRGRRLQTIRKNWRGGRIEHLEEKKQRTRKPPWPSDSDRRCVKGGRGAKQSTLPTPFFEQTERPGVGRRPPIRGKHNIGGIQLFSGFEDLEKTKPREGLTHERTSDSNKGGLKGEQRTNLINLLRAGGSDNDSKPSANHRAEKKNDVGLRCSDSLPA